MKSPALLDRLGTLLRARLARRELGACARPGRSPRASARVWIHGDGEIFVGDRFFFDASAAPIDLHRWLGASIVIGDDCRLGGTSIELVAAPFERWQLALAPGSSAAPREPHPIELRSTCLDGCGSPQPSAGAPSGSTVAAPPPRERLRSGPGTR